MDLTYMTPHVDKMIVFRAGENLERWLANNMELTINRVGCYVISAPHYFGSQIRIGRALKNMKDRLRAHMRSWPDHLDLNCLIIFNDTPEAKKYANKLEKEMMLALQRYRVKKRGISWYDVPYGEPRENFYSQVMSWRYSKL